MNNLITNSQDTSPQTKYRNDYNPSNFIISNIHLNFDLEDTKTIVKSSLKVSKNNHLKSDTNPQLSLNGEHLELLSISLNGNLLNSTDYKVDDNFLTLQNLPDSFTLDIITEIDPLNNTRLEGLFKSSGNFCTQCEAEGFRNITYTLDRPDVMSIFTTTIVADKKKYPYLLSNGNLIEQGECDNGQHFATWNDPFPKPCYLFALVAGDFDLLEDQYTTMSGRDVALKIYVDKGKLDQCHHAMKSLKNAMHWDEEKYNLEYDLDIYMIVAVSDFNMGAMENKGLNVFNTAYVLANEQTATDDNFEAVEGVIAHEYFHNWTGNRVTCRDWFQLSLKEGLTVFRDQEFSSDMNSRAVKRIQDAKDITSFQFREDSGPMAHPIRPDSYIEMNNFYTHTVYIKGAEVIRMIQTLLGESGFYKGIALYFKRHDGHAVTCEDFVVAMEDANDANLRQFRRWYSQAGTPEVTVSSSWNQSVGEYHLTITQETPSTPGQPTKDNYLIPIRMALYSNSGEQLALKTSLSDDSNESELTIKHNQKQQTYVFYNLKEEPTPSLLRGFSAPVQLNYNYTEQQLSVLLAYDSDSYTHWQSGQRLMLKTILENVQRLENAQDLQFPNLLIHAFAKQLEAPISDPSLLALSLSLPELTSVLEQYKTIPFDSIISVHEALSKHLATHLNNQLVATYDLSELMLSASNKKAANNKDYVGWRRLKNATLELMTHSNKSELGERAINQYNNSSNMTECLTALKIITHSNSQHREEILNSFYQKWRHEKLVIDKWFAVQSNNPSSNAIQTIEDLMKHADFELSNPNRCRSVLGTFSNYNLKQFHQKSGLGYHLVTDAIIKLNVINPQVAARMVQVFNSFKKFDSVRQQLMKEQLTRILDTPNLSADVYEIVSKTIAVS